MLEGEKQREQRRKQQRESENNTVRGVGGAAWWRAGTPLEAVQPMGDQHQSTGKE